MEQPKSASSNTPASEASPSTPRSILVADILDDYIRGVRERKAPPLYRVGRGALENVRIGPGRILTIGGYPGAGKTAIACQFVFDALALDPTLRVLICNAESPPGVLLDRQLARIGGVSATEIHERTFDDEGATRIEAAAQRIGAVSDRLRFLEPPLSVELIREEAVKTGATLIVADYLQQIPAALGYQTDDVAGVSASMRGLRQLANNGCAVLVLSALTRPAPGVRPGMHSFRGSSEIEYGSDDAYLLETDNPSDGVCSSTLRHTKSRYSAKADIALRFTESLQRFDPKESESE